MKPIWIIFTTYAPPGQDGERRIASAEKTLASWAQHLQYNGPLHLHVADDGTTPGAYPSQLKRLWPGDITFSRQERQGVGASLNRGVMMGLEAGFELFLYAVDDWALSSDLNLDPWARILVEEASIGMVRLGPPHPQLMGRIENHNGDSCNAWVMRLDRYGFAFAHRPALYHRRFFEAYGMFQGGVNALVCEQVYSEHFNATPGPDIALALLHPWWHVGDVELGDITPA